MVAELPPCQTKMAGLSSLKTAVVVALRLPPWAPTIWTRRRDACEPKARLTIRSVCATISVKVAAPAPARKVAASSAFRPQVAGWAVNSAATRVICRLRVRKVLWVVKARGMISSGSWSARLSPIWATMGSLSWGSRAISTWLERKCSTYNKQVAWLWC